MQDPKIVEGVGNEARHENGGTDCPPLFTGGLSPENIALRTIDVTLTQSNLAPERQVGVLIMGLVLAVRRIMDGNAEAYKLRSPRIRLLRRIVEVVNSRLNLYTRAKTSAPKFDLVKDEVTR